MKPVKAILERGDETVSRRLKNGCGIVRIVCDDVDVEQELLEMCDAVLPQIDLVLGK